MRAARNAPCLKPKMEVPLRIYTYYRLFRQIDKQCKQPPVTEKYFEDQVSKELVIYIFLMISSSGGINTSKIIFKRYNSICSPGRIN